MKKKMMKALKDLNAYIDDDREKLCDRIKKLECAHNRMFLLLKASQRLFDVIYCRVELPDDLVIRYMDLICALDKEIRRKVL